MSDNDDTTSRDDEVTAEDYDNLASGMDSGTFGWILLFPICLAVVILAQLVIR